MAGVPAVGQGLLAQAERHSELLVANHEATLAQLGEMQERHAAQLKRERTEHAATTRALHAQLLAAMEARDTAAASGDSRAPAGSHGGSGHVAGGPSGSAGAELGVGQLPMRQVRTQPLKWRDQKWRLAVVVPKEVAPLCGQCTDHR